jgi:hypothetical protein
MSRTNLIRLVRVAARDLKLDDDTRRALQLRVVGKESLSEMSEADINMVVEEMRRMGFKSTGTRRPMAARADTRFAHKLWGLLFTHDKVKVRGAAGLNAFVRERFGDAWGAVPIDIDQLQDGDKINDVVQALKAMCRRAGIKLEVR